MASIAVRANDIIYRDVWIRLTLVKQLIQLNFKEEEYSEFRLESSKTFNTKTGKIEYKYAWDSIICHLWAEQNEKMKPILDSLVDTVKDR
jgi:hypothetical protein